MYHTHLLTMKRHYLFLLTSVLFAQIANAQVGFGPEIGLNGSDYMKKVAGQDKTTQMRFGIRLGALTDICLSDNVYLQPGIYAVNNGYKAKFTGGHDEYSINTLEIPVNIIYKFRTFGTNRFFLGVGPYFGYNVNGYYKVFSAPYVDSKSDLRIGGGATDQVNNLDIGAGINMGFQFKEGLFFRVRAQAGFTNMAAPLANDNNTLRSFSFGVTGGYLFYLKDKNGTTVRMRRKKDRHSKAEQRH